MKPDTTRKKSGTPAGASTSSVGTAASTRPGDVLDLGQHLVQELGFEESFETLGRWMAHHIAELMESAADKSLDSEARARAARIVEETILRVWAFRQQLPGGAYPLRRYEGLLEVLSTVAGGLDSFRYYGARNGDRAELCARFYAEQSLLIGALLAMELPQEPDDEPGCGAAVAALDEEEAQMLVALRRLRQQVENAAEASGVEVSVHAGPPPLEALVRSSIQRLAETLAELEADIGSEVGPE